MAGLGPAYRGPHELAGDAAATQRLRHLGVEQEEAVAAQPVHELAFHPLGPHDEPVFGGDVDDVHGVAVVCQGWSSAVVAIDVHLMGVEGTP